MSGRRFVVIGAGSIGRRHAKNLVALGAGTVTVCDPDPAACETAVREIGCAAVTGLDAALAPGPDAVLVCTPTHLHLPAARAAIAAGAHVFMEKPIAESLDGVADLVAAARAARRMLLVGCNMRFHPGVAALKHALDEGTPRVPPCFRARFSHYLPNWRPGSDYRNSYSARRAHGGGIVLEGVHEIDYVRWMAGEVSSVSAWAGHLSTLDIDSEDCALVELSCKSGATAQIHLDYLSPLKLRGCEIIGEDAVLRWASEGKTPERVRVTRYRNGAEEETLLALDAYDGNAMYLEELRHFLACLDGTETPQLDGEQAYRVLELALAARDAADRRP